MAIYDSRYPKVITDTTSQSVNPNLKKEITVEEWYDLLHHTHAEFSNSSSGGSTGGGNSGNVDLTHFYVDVAGWDNKLDALTTLIQSQSEDITVIKGKIDNIEAYIDQDIQING